MFTPSDLFVALALLSVDTLDSASITIDVNELVRRAQAGDREAVGTIYQAHVQPIYRYIAYRVRNTADVEDLTAEVFVRMVQRISSYQITEAPFAAWLYRIAATRIADYYREINRRPENPLTEAVPSENPLPEETILHKQSFEKLRSALHALSEEQQTILVLRFVERKSHEDVAALLGKSVTAVKSAQHRALTQLTEVLGAGQKARHYLRGVNE